MAIPAGVRVEETGDFYCAKCNAKVHVKKSDRIPRCPQGHSELKSPTEEHRRRS